MWTFFLTSCAVMALAGAAQAQAILISGEGRTGIIGQDAGLGWAWIHDNHLDLEFNVAVEGDHGLSFGAWTYVEVATGAAGIFSGTNVWVEANDFV